jgi:hypothetical protein
MKGEGEIVNTVPVPTVLDCEELSVSLDTEYPFENSFRYTVRAKRDIRFTVKIPSFAQTVTLDGKPYAESEVTLALKAGETRAFAIAYTTPPRLEARPYGLYTAKCGSLIFSLPVSYEKKSYEYEKDGVERVYPYCDYEYLPTSDWSVALASETLELERRAVAETPFSSTEPAVVLKTRVVPIAWGYEDGYDAVCAKVPASTEPTGEAREVELYPYGNAKLRVTELPKAKN